MENPQIVTVFSKSPKKEKVSTKKKSKPAWSSSRSAWKNFQNKFFKYLMTNNDVGLSEIVQKFFHGLDFESLLHCRLVCKTWYRFLNQFPGFWLDSLKEVREKFLYEPRNYMKRWRILQWATHYCLSNKHNIQEVKPSIESFFRFYITTLVLFYKQHMIKKTSWTFLDFIQSLLIFVA
jgi:hypothetical protein